MASLRGDKAEAEVVRMELLLEQEKAASLMSMQGQSETHEVAVQAQTCAVFEIVGWLENRVWRGTSIFPGKVRHVPRRNQPVLRRKPPLC